MATIGTFDGIHLGHQRIIGRVIDEARRRRLPALVFSFEPTPAEFFSAGQPPARLTGFREKFVALAELGVEVFFCPPFDAAMESLSPEAFIQRWMLETLRVHHLVVGDDFRFGHRRAGGFADLARAATAHGFGIERAASVLLDGQRVSSTAIREALAAGQLERARRLLGRYYRMLGRVVPGRRLGRKLGFPTANVRLNRRAVALGGIFAVWVQGLPESPVPGVASLGYRPTVANDGELLLEVHLFDFQRPIYGEHIGVDFVAKLRDEQRFADVASLVAQMHADAAQARALLAGRERQQP